MKKSFTVFCSLVFAFQSNLAQSPRGQEARENRERNATQVPRWEITEEKIYKLKGFTDSTQLNFTKRSDCEFRCLGLKDAELRTILLFGLVNLERSELDYKPFPVYAVEATANSGEKFRVSSTPDGNALKIISIQRLDKKIRCDCKN
jgi:hypothetical protein